MITFLLTGDLFKKCIWPEISDKFFTNLLEMEILLKWAINCHLIQTIAIICLYASPIMLFLVHSIYFLIFTGWTNETFTWWVFKTKYIFQIIDSHNFFYQIVWRVYLKILCWVTFQLSNVNATQLLRRCYCLKWWQGKVLIQGKN